MGRKSIIYILIIGFFSMINLAECFAKEYKISSAYELSQISLVPGDVVIMANGTWEDETLTLKGNGTESLPITLRAETAGQVLLTGESRLSFSGEYLIIDGLQFNGGFLEGDPVIQFRTSSSNVAKHCRLTNSSIKDYNPWDPSEAYKWVSLYGEYNQIDNCSFIGKNHQGALMVVWLDDTPNYHVIKNNYFADIPELGQNGGETIRIGTSSTSTKDSYTIVENNLFENCDGEIEIISNKSCENIYRHNTFLNCEGTLTLRHGNRCKIYGNFFFGDINKSSGGVRVIGEDHKVYNNYFQDIKGGGFRAAISVCNGVPNSPLNRYFQVKYAEISNNTIVNCKYPITIGAGKSDELILSPYKITISNNVIANYNGITQRAITYTDTPEDITYAGNMVYAPSKMGQTPDHINTNDPKLLEVNGMYRPDDKSPVVGFGKIIDDVEADIDGQIRENSNDAGCDQVSENPIVNVPFKTSDVSVLIGAKYRLADLLSINNDAEYPIPTSIIYPNPSNGFLQVKNCSKGNLNIYSLSGYQIYSCSNINDKSIIEVSLNKGIYIVQIQSETGTLIDKIVLI